MGGRFNPFRTSLYSFPPSRIIFFTSFLKILSLTSLYSFGTGIHFPARYINLPCSSIFPIPTAPSFVCMVTYSSFILHHQFLIRIGYIKNNMHMKFLPMILTLNLETMKLHQTSIFHVHANVFCFRYNYIPLCILFALRL